MGNKRFGDQEGGENTVEGGRRWGKVAKQAREHGPRGITQQGKGWKGT